MRGVYGVELPRLRGHLIIAGRPDMTKLLTVFGVFFGEHAEHLRSLLLRYRDESTRETGT